jgi:hypothetical protein
MYLFESMPLDDLTILPYGIASFPRVLSVPWRRCKRFSYQCARSADVACH